MVNALLICLISIMFISMVAIFWFSSLLYKEKIRHDKGIFLLFFFLFFFLFSIFIILAPIINRIISILLRSRIDLDIFIYSLLVLSFLINLALLIRIEKIETSLSNIVREIGLEKLRMEKSRKK